MVVVGIQPLSPSIDIVQRPSLGSTVHIGT